MTADGIDLGHDHVVRFTRWAPDRSIQANAEHYRDVANVERFGLLVEHLTPAGRPCVGSVNFDTPQAALVCPGQAVWQVQTWEPLTLSPSLLCSCGDHGWIREGRWVVA